MTFKRNNYPCALKSIVNESIGCFLGVFPFNYLSPPHLLFTAPVCFSMASLHTHSSCTSSFWWLCEGKSNGGGDIYLEHGTSWCWKTLERPGRQGPCGPRLSSLSTLGRSIGSLMWHSCLYPHGWAGFTGNDAGHITVTWPQECAFAEYWYRHPKQQFLTTPVHKGHFVP